MADLNFFETDPRGSEVPDPRGYRKPEPVHQRSLDDLDRGYDNDNVSSNGNRRRHNDADYKGSLSNDLESGRGSQGWKGCRNADAEAPN